MLQSKKNNKLRADKKLEIMDTYTQKNRRTEVSSLSTQSNLREYQREFQREYDSQCGTILGNILEKNFHLLRLKK